MDADDNLPRRSAGPLAELAGEDLDTLSVEAIDERIAALEAEIERARAQRRRAFAGRAGAEALFRR